MGYRKESYKLRFFDLNAKELGIIQAALEDTPPLAQRASHVAVFDVTHFSHFAGVCRAVEQLCLKRGQVELIASLSTSSNNGGIEVPSPFLDLIRNSICAVSFSFLNLGEDDEDGETTEFEDAVAPN